MATALNILGLIVVFVVVVTIIAMAGLAFTKKMGPIESLKYLLSKLKGG